MKINLGVQPKKLEESQKLLNSLLADEYILYTKTLNYHWNVSGIRFNDLHLFFRVQYEALFQIVDDVAERARTVGAKAFGTTEEFRKHSRLKEFPGKVPEAQSMIENLFEDHQTVIRFLRKSISTCESYADSGTANFMTDLMENHEKMAWMLRAFLEK